MKKQDSKFKKAILMLMVAGMLAIALAGLTACKKDRTIDDFWFAVVRKDNDGSEYVTIRGLASKGLVASKTQKEATIPETIKGYPVKVLDATPSFNFSGWGQTYPADLGELEFLVIEPSVTIKSEFFYSCMLKEIEFRGEQGPILHSPGFLNRLLLIIPENSENGYLPVGYKRSEIINGCIVRENVFYGFSYECSKEYAEMPEGVTRVILWSTLRYVQPATIKFPSTLIIIPHNNSHFSYFRYAALKKVIVCADTIIETGAFYENVEIQIYN